MALHLFGKEVTEVQFFLAAPLLWKVLMSEFQKWAASFAITLVSVTFLATVGFLMSTYPGIMLILILGGFFVAIVGVIRVNFFR